MQRGIYVGDCVGTRNDFVVVDEENTTKAIM